MHRNIGLLLFARINSELCTLRGTSYVLVASERAVGLAASQSLAKGRLSRRGEIKPLGGTVPTLRRTGPVAYTHLTAPTKIGVSL